MWVALSFCCAAGLSFALSVVVADILGPALFGRYAIALSAVTIVATLLFDWLRLSVTRFWDGDGSTGDALRGASILAGILVLATAPAAWLLLGDRLATAALLGGLALGLFDIAAAAVRVRGTERLYAGVVTGRAAGSFGLSALAAWASLDPAAAIGAAALATAGAGLLALERIGTLGRPSRLPDPARLRTFAAYALPVVLAGALFQLVPLTSRWVLAERAGLVEAGLLALPGEIAMRLFQNMGAALDAALFPLAVRAAREAGPAAGTARLSDNLGLVAAIVAPAAVGLMAVWPSFEALLLPPSFAGRVEGVALAAVPALALFALALYGIAPALQLRGTTWPVAAASGLCAAAVLALALLWPAPTACAAAWFQLAGYGLATLVLLGAAARMGQTLPWRALATAVAAALVMGGVLWPWRAAGPPMLLLPAQILCGAAVYSALALMANLAGSRDHARTMLRRISR